MEKYTEILRRSVILFNCQISSQITIFICSLLDMFQLLATQRVESKTFILISIKSVQNWIIWIYCTTYFKYYCKHLGHPLPRSLVLSN